MKGTKEQEREAEAYVYWESRSRAHKFPRSLFWGQNSLSTRSYEKNEKMCFFVSLHRLEEEEDEEERLCALPREQGHEIFSWFLENYQLLETHTEEDTTSAKF